MIIASVWIAVMVLFVTIQHIVHKAFKTMPIVVYLLLATGMLPFIMMFVESTYQVKSPELIASPTIQILYKVVFAILWGYILQDVGTIRSNIKSAKIALSSFLIPFTIGVLAAHLLSITNTASMVTLGLIFSITAISVLYLFLQNAGYPDLQRQKLIQSSVLMDLACWSVLSLVHSTGSYYSLFFALLLGLLPYVGVYLWYRIAGKMSGMLYGSLFVIILFISELMHYNTLLAGIICVSIASHKNIEIIFPYSAKVFKVFQNYIAVPFILVYGVVQVQLDLLQDVLNIKTVILLVLLPIMVKVGGSLAGLYWAEKKHVKSLLPQAIMLNIRGLTGLMFLNLTLKLQLISSGIYFMLLIMCLCSTLLPILVKNHYHEEYK